MADSNKPIVPGGDTVGTVGEVYLSKNGKTYECVAVIDNITITPNGETIPRVEYVWVCTDDGAGGGAFPFDVSDAEPITISRTKEELIAAIDAGKTPIGYWRHTQSNGTVIRLFHFVKRFNATDGINLTFYFSDKTSSGILDIRADGTIKRTYQHNDGGGASGSENFTFTITPTNGPGSQMLSVTRAEMLSALDAGKTLLGYWTETRTILETTDAIKHEFRLESVSGTGASRGLAFVNYEQFYKSTLYVNGNDTVSFVDKERLLNPMTKTEAMTQSVGMDDDGRLWTEPGADGITPHIGDNGNWYLGDTDTGKPSRGAGIDITGATIGQIAKITSVDDTGKPTAWEPMDIPSGGSDISLGLTAATVGQAIKVKAVDTDGKPTEWQAVTPETWNFVMADGTTVTKKVYVDANE